MSFKSTSSSSLTDNSECQEIAICVHSLSKCYQIYDAPRERLKQFILPHLRQMVGKSPKQYYREFWALKDVSFEIRKGETVGIIGLNGSGKSTLLQMICGTLNPTSGSIQTYGRIAALLELGSGFNPEFTGRENVYMNASVLGLSNEEINSRFDYITAFADIGDFIEQPVKTYSSGMVVRLAFAVAVCVDPDILIIDEALAVGDAAFQFKCMERMQRLTKSGTTLLFVSHDMNMVKSFCHQVIYLEHGHEKMRGQPDTVAEQYFLDIRDEQSRQTVNGKPVVIKKSLGESGLPAFGTEQGRIVSACFLPDESMKTSVGSGESVRIRIETQFDCDLPGAALSVILMDRRMLDITGKYFFLRADSTREGKSIATIEVAFDARFWPGTYFVTLRLESRGIMRNFIPVDKQTAVLSFEVNPYEPDFLGTVDIGMRQVHSPSSAPVLVTEKKRVVALLAIRNEALYLPRCLEHLHQQGIETCVIDNDSCDESLAIAKQYLGRGVFRIERQPYTGYFDLVEQLRIKEQLAAEIEADWFIHHDADEIREPPPGFSTLLAALIMVDQAGYNAVNFDEFVFLPVENDCEDSEPSDFVARFRDYYFFSPQPLHRVNAWKKQSSPVDLVSMAGHQVVFPKRNLYPEAFILRHYLALSRKHLLKKYGQERIYSPKEVEERQWHGARARFDPSKVRLPRRQELKNFDNDGWDRSNPFTTHPFFGE
ncbi:MAG: ATP-binding cassette domain-containing protein [Desulfocapsaceae bacterium]|nr:ATP-binding cassette domain-containing protein [Desulfocapsaceae bacterium]